MKDWKYDDIYFYNQYDDEIAYLKIDIKHYKWTVEHAENMLKYGDLTPNEHKRFASMRTKNLHNIRKCEYGIQRRENDMKRIEQKYH